MGKTRASLSWLATALLLTAFLGSCTFTLNPTSFPVTSIRLTDSPQSLTFGDMSFDARLGKVLIPGGGTGKLFLIDPQTREVSAISGFTTGNNAGGVSVTSGRELLFAVDRGEQSLSVIDPTSGAILTSSQLMGTPEYIRFIPTNNELWVTEPGLEQIEVFSLSNENPPKPIHSGVISIKNGPEGLVFDQTRGLAYTNRPKVGLTTVIQIQTHGIVSEWGNGCSQANGMALDVERGFLFIACGEGKVVMLDSNHGGTQIASQIYGAELNLIGYNPTLGHVYLPSGSSAILAIFEINQFGGETPTSNTTPDAAHRISLTRLGTADTALNANCVVTDNLDQVWVCDPGRGQLFLIKDNFRTNEY